MHAVPRPGVPIRSTRTSSSEKDCGKGGHGIGSNKRGSITRSRIVANIPPLG